MIPSPRRFLIACVVSTSCFLGAFLVAAEWLASVLAIGSIFLGIPISIALYLDFVRALGRQPETRPVGLSAIVLCAPIFVLGALSLISGSAIIVWVLYNTLIERDPHYSGPTSFGGFGIGPLLVIFGWRWITSPFKASDRRIEAPRITGRY
jgi:hypothetical protein